MVNCGDFCLRTSQVILHALILQCTYYVWVHLTWSFLFYSFEISGKVLRSYVVATLLYSKNMFRLFSRYGSIWVWKLIVSAKIWQAINADSYVQKQQIDVSKPIHYELDTKKNILERQENGAETKQWTSSVSRTSSKFKDVRPAW